MIFRNWVLQNFPFLEDDFDALTDYELFCKMVEYMKKSLEKIKEYQQELDVFNAKLDEFQHYFDNLDVQEEINNKLDEMAASGELADIIAQYLGLAGVLAYNTVAEMKEAENIVNGSICKTLGYASVNDKGGAYYKVRTILNTDTIDEALIIALADENLVAELVNTGVNNIKVFNDNIAIGIANSNKLYLNDDTYELEVESTIEASNVEIIGNGSKIYTESNVTNIFDLNNVVIKDVEFKETNISDNTKNILFTGKNIKLENCIIESTIGYQGEIENIEFYNCEFKNYYREIVQLHGTLNNLKVINCKFTRVQNYSTPYQGNNRIYIYNHENNTNALTEAILALRGNGIEIKDCVFANGNVRQIHIFNCINVNIENNIFNASGDVRTTLGGSDDLVSIDCVKYFTINNNYFGPSGENEIDLLSCSFGEVKNNNLSKSYDQYEINIDWSDYVRAYGESLTDKTLLKCKDVEICNNTITSNTYTFFISPSDNIHINDNNIVNNEGTTIILFSDYGTLDTSHPSGLKIEALDVGRNNVTTSLGNFGKASVRTGYNFVIDQKSGHLSEDICCYETQEVSAATMVYCTPSFPCKNGKAGKLVALDGSFRSVTPSIVRWQNSQSTRRGIDFVGNRYNSPYWGTMFYTGDYLDNYPLGQAGDANGSYDGTQTTGTIAFKSW